jgi:DNA replication protein DnaC
MTNDARRQRAAALQLHGILAHWAECAEQPWLDPLLSWEESERARRSLERRLRCAHIGRFKPLADFDWTWPQQCDQRAIAELMTLDFVPAATNVLLVGSSGLGKTMIAQNIAHQAILEGHTVLFATAGQLLGDLAGLDSDSALRYRLRRYAAPDLLVIDEVGYLSYSNRHADLLFELINRNNAAAPGRICEVGPPASGSSFFTKPLFALRAQRTSCSARQPAIAATRGRTSKPCHQPPFRSRKTPETKFPAIRPIRHGFPVQLSPCRDHRLRRFAVRVGNRCFPTSGQSARDASWRLVGYNVAQ